MTVAELRTERARARDARTRATNVVARERAEARFWACCEALDARQVTAR